MSLRRSALPLADVGDAHTAGVPKSLLQEVPQVVFAGGKWIPILPEFSRPLRISWFSLLTGRPLVGENKGTDGSDM